MGPPPSPPEDDAVAGQANEPRTRGVFRYEEAEELLGSLKGVLSARLVVHPDGVVEEIHVLTTDDVSPKQTVRNVESALLARYDITLDHRKISVAQTTARPTEVKHGLKPAREGVEAKPRKSVGPPPAPPSRGGSSTDCRAAIAAPRPNRATTGSNSVRCGGSG